MFMCSIVSGIRRIWWILCTACYLAAPGGLQASEEFYFAHISDTHWGTTGAMERTVQVVEKLRGVPRKLDFLVVTGDVTHEGVSDEDVARGKAFLQSLGIPIYYVAGNHDLSRKSQRELFESKIGQLNFVKPHKGLVLVFVSSPPWGQRNSDTPGVALDWLEKTLDRLGQQPVLLFHHAPPVRELDSEEVCRGWERLLNAHPVKAVFSGHLHMDAMLWYGSVPEYVTSCIRTNGDSPLSFRVYGYRTDGRVSFVTFNAGK
jgi:Icc protein